MPDTDVQAGTAITRQEQPQEEPVTHDSGKVFPIIYREFVNQAIRGAVPGA